jgi:hypothetical protein
MAKRMFAVIRLAFKDASKPGRKRRTQHVRRPFACTTRRPPLAPPAKAGELSLFWTARQYYNLHDRHNH